MRQRFALSLVCLLLWLAVWPSAMAPAQDAPASLRLELFALRGPEGAGPLAVLFLTPAQGWHTYDNNPGETGQPTQAELSLKPGDPALKALYPQGKEARDAFEPDQIVRIYEAETPIFFNLPGQLADKISLAGSIKLLLCSDKSCRPSDLTVEAAFDLSKDSLPWAESQAWWPLYQSLSGQNNAQPAKLTPVAAKKEAKPSLSGFEASELGLKPEYFSASLEVSDLWQAALLAFLAGLVLNFMPCVLPVISLKFSGLLAVCANCTLTERQSLLRQHNFFFALGVVLYFLSLGVLLGLADLAWGQIFQKPELIMGVSMLLFALGLSLFGVFHLPIIHTGPVAADKSPGLQAFLTGLTATLLATPCSGPFLGGVLAWTLPQPVPVILSVFFCLGLGMASPYILFALRPEAIRFFPRPGAWMQRLEKILGFFLLATVVYFVTMLPERLLASAMALLWATALAAWIWGGLTNLSQPSAKRVCIRASAVSLLLAAWFAVWDTAPPGQSKFEPYQAESFREELGKSNILLDFSASWCPTCKVLERTVLTSANLRKWSEKYGLKLVQADISVEDKQAMSMLKALGSQSIPLVAIFPKGEGSRSPLVLRDLFSAGQLEDALKRASK